jgi:hypothetical protein
MFSFFISIYYWERLRYNASFAFVFACNIAVACALVLLLAFFIKLIKYLLLRFCTPKKISAQESRQEEPESIAEPFLVHSDAEQTLPPSLPKRIARFLCRGGVKGFANVLNLIAFALFIVAILVFSIIPSAFYGMHLLSFVPSMLAMMTFYLFWIGLLLMRTSLKKKEKIEDPETGDNSPTNRRNYTSRFKVALQRHKILFSFLGALSLFLSIGVPLAMKDSCLCVFSKDFGISVLNGTAVFSSRLIRSFTVEKVCPPGPPCHVYATLPSNTSEAVFINAHTDYDVDSVTVAYDRLDYYNANASLRYNAVSSTYKLDFEDKGRRAVHTTLLYNLEPETEYYYQIIYDNTTYFSSNYKTLPSKGTHSPIVMAIGGDVGSSDIGPSVTSSLSKNGPDVMIVGGDAAYDDGIQACYYSWDMYLWGFEKYNAQVNRTIPFIVSVGNHDVGFNAMSEAKLNKIELPLYFAFLPQHLKVDNSTGQEVVGVPDVHERRTRFYHLIGNMLHFSLDSGYVETYENQAVWMREILPQYEGYTKFGNYHVPIYPACVNVMDTSQEHLQVAKENFVPVFEDFKFKAIFENHVHVFKKTFPLKQGVVDPNGVVYFGDGNWGITPNGCIEDGELENKTGIHEAASSRRHVWVLKLNDTGYDIFPVDEAGNQFYKATSGDISLVY